MTSEDNQEKPESNALNQSSEKCIQSVLFVPVSCRENPALDKEVQFLTRFACKRLKGLTVLDRSKSGQGFYVDKTGSIDRDYIALLLVVAHDLPINRTYVEQMRRHTQIALRQEDVWALETPVTLHRSEHKVKSMTKISKDIGNLAKSLSNPKRVEIINSVLPQPKHLSEIAKECSISKQNCSKHVKRLENIGVLEAHGLGLRRIYAPSPLIRRVLSPLSEATQILACDLLLKKLSECVKYVRGKLVIEQHKRKEVEEIVLQLNHQLFWDKMEENEQAFFMDVEEALMDNAANGQTNKK
jgi:DNA-binding MarR family transcriptional regulator